VGHNRITVFDTTLRDGEQSVGVALTPSEKVAIALQLERLRVDVVEAGFPAASDGEWAGVHAVAAALRGPIVAAMARATESDVDAAASALEPAHRSRVHIVLATSDVHLDHKLLMTPDEVIERTQNIVAYAAARVDEVEFCCEDASRTDPAFVVQVCRAAVEAGATVLNVPDTVGYAIPSEYAALIQQVVAACPAAVVAAHCHDDLGLATANTLAAVAAGGRQVECTINGLGERAGNAALEEVVTAVAHHSRTLRAMTDVDLEELTATSELVSRLTGVPLAAHKAVVGANARR
jgi:2-isopropylmalate synthase